MSAGGGTPLPASSDRGGCWGRSRRPGPAAGLGLLASAGSTGRRRPVAYCWPGLSCVCRIYKASAAGGSYVCHVSQCRLLSSPEPWHKFVGT